MFLVLSGGAAQIDSYEMHVSPTKSVSRVKSKEKMIWFVRNEPFSHDFARRSTEPKVSNCDAVHRDQIPDQTLSVQNWGDMMKLPSGYLT